MLDARYSPMPSVDFDALLRFFARISIVGEHWIWDPDAADSGNGYGKFFADGKNQMAHRWAYEFFRERIPKRKLLDHLCRVRACCNPWHLQPVTNKVNTLRGEGPTAKNAAKKHCKRGHALKGKNVLRRKDRPGHRECRECRNTRAREGRRGS